MVIELIANRPLIADRLHFDQIANPSTNRPLVAQEDWQEKARQNMPFESHWNGKRLPKNRKSCGVLGFRIKKSLFFLLRKDEGKYALPMRRAFLLPCWGRRNSLSFWTNGGSEKKGVVEDGRKQFKKCFSRNLHGHGTIFAKTCLFVPNLWRFQNFQLQISRFAEEKTFHYVFLSTAEAHCSGLSVAIYCFVHTWLCQISF